MWICEVCCCGNTLWDSSVNGPEDNKTMLLLVCEKKCTDAGRDTISIQLQLEKKKWSGKIREPSHLQPVTHNRDSSHPAVQLGPGIFTLNWG